MLASLNPIREFDEGILDQHRSNVLFFQGSLNEPIFLNSCIYFGKECDPLNNKFQSLHVSCLLRFKDLFLGKGKEIEVTNVVSDSPLWRSRFNRLSQGKKVSLATFVPPCVSRI